MKNLITGLRGPWAIPTLGLVLCSGCLPEDTRPEPATIVTDFALASQEDTDLEDGLSFVTDDGYEVTFTQIVLTLGRIEFSGDGCNAYAAIGGPSGLYARVMDALQPEEQQVGLSYAIGECSMGFQMAPPEDWAHIDNPGASEALRDSLRAVDFPNQEMIDPLAGPRGTKGASLRLVGQGRKLEGDDEPVDFLFEFPTETPSPLCAPDGEEFYDLRGGQRPTTVIEMHPEKLFGTCGDSTELRFAAIAAAEPTDAGEPLTLADLEKLDPQELEGEGARKFYSCDQGTELINTEDTDTLLNLRGWLGFRSAFDLFGVRDAECRRDVIPLRR